MPRGSDFANEYLLLVFHGTAIAGIADVAAAPLSDLFVSLHSADPGAGGDQTENELSYSGYARVAVPRTPAGWTVAANVASATADILFPAAGGGVSVSATHFMIGTALNGAGKNLFSVAISPGPLAITEFKTPRLLNSQTRVTAT